LGRVSSGAVSIFEAQRHHIIQKWHKVPTGSKYMNEPDIFEIQAELCRAMGSPLRMKIVHLLRAGPLTVNEIASAMKAPQASISRNLAILRNTRVVTVHREGTNAVYQISNPKILSVCDMMREVLSEQASEQAKFMEKTKR